MSILKVHYTLASKREILGDLDLNNIDHNFLGYTISYYEIASLFFSAIALYISYKNYRRLSAGIRIFIEERENRRQFCF